MKRSEADITGSKYGMLKAVKNSHWRGNNSYWFFKCDCGNEKSILKTEVKTGRVVSCGCYKPNRKHGMSLTPVYKVWKSLRGRCLNEKHPSFKYYGGRGITVSKKWGRFEAFYEDMGDRPSEKHSIERVDVNKGYSKKNCKWATIDKQNKNKTTSININHKGETKNIKDWTRHLGLDYRNTVSRYHRGLPLEDVFYKGNLRHKKKEASWSVDSKS